MSRKWKTVKLHDVCDLQNGYAFKSSSYVEHSNTLSCRMSNIRPNGYFDLEHNKKYLPNSYAQTYKQYLLKDGDVIIAMTDMATEAKILGVPTVVSTQGKNLLLNQRVGKLTIKNPEITDFSYLKYALNRKKVKKYFLRFAGGGLQINLGKNDLLSVQIPLPPIDEQRRIAAILDQADAIRRKRQQAIALTDELLRSTFLEMFGDPLQKGDNKIEFGKLAEIVMGQSPPGSSYNFNGEGMPLLNGPAEFGENHPLEKQWTNKPTRVCNSGDILFCVRGATAGRLNWADKPYCIGRGLAAIRPQFNSLINQEVVFVLLEQFYPYFQNQGVGSTFINISRKDIEQLLVPQLDSQDSNTFFMYATKLRKIKALDKKSLTESNNLFNSLLQRAFKGQL